LKKVKDIMTREVITIYKNDDLYQVAKIMEEKNIGSVVVMDKDKPVGIATERDIITRCLAKGLEPKKCKVSDIMSSPLVNIEPDCTIEDAARLMISKMFRRLLVVENDKVKGIITSSDLMRNSVAKTNKKEDILIYLASDYEVF
jgi:CBS domain-containing protein